MNTFEMSTDSSYSVGGSPGYGMTFSSTKHVSIWPNLNGLFCFD